MSSILQRIIDTKKAEVLQLKNSGIMSTWKGHPALNEASRGFEQALRKPGLSIIAEIKKASPSKGLIRPDFHPATIAQEYLSGGADCLSVLTDRDYFHGNLQYLTEVKHTVPMPLLRKDFIIDEAQITEAKIHGADAILLIAEVLSPAQITELTHCAHSLQLDVLLETHHISELEKIDFSHNTIVGINNRDLNTFITDVQTTVAIARLLPPHVLIVSESGIDSRESIKTVQTAGAHAVLVGEHFMRRQDIAGAVAEMKGWIDEN